MACFRCRISLRWQHKLAATPKESTAKNGCVTKDRDAGLPGKGDRDTKNEEVRRYEKQGRESSAEEVAVLLQSGPKDRAIRESHADTEAMLGQLLAINHLAPGRTGVQGCNAHHVAGVPGLLREYAGAVRADVIGEGLLPIGRRAYQRREAHDDYDWQPPFDSASSPVVQRDLAQTLIG